MHQKLHVLAGFRKTIESCLSSIETDQIALAPSHWEPLIREQGKRCVRKIGNFKYTLTPDLYARFLKYCCHDALEIRYLILELKQLFDQCGAKPLLNEFFEIIELVLSNVFKKIMLPEDFYADFNYPCAEPYSQEKLQVLSADLLILRAKLKSRDIATELQNPVLDYYYRLQVKKNHTYRDLHYAQSLMDVLIRLLGDGNTTDWNITMMRKLIACNFNTSHFYTYCIEQINDNITQTTYPDLKLLVIQKYIRDLRGIAKQDKMICNPDLESMTTFLFRYLLEEREALRMLLNSPQMLPAQAEIKPVEVREDKLITSFNMPELAMFISLLIATGIIKCDTGEQKRIAAFYARHYSTIGQENLSTDSLYKRLKEKEVSTCKKMAAVLESMLSIIHGYEII